MTTITSTRNALSKTARTHESRAVRYRAQMLANQIDKAAEFKDDPRFTEQFARNVADFKRVMRGDHQ